MVIIENALLATRVGNIGRQPLLVLVCTGISCRETGPTKQLITTYIRYPSKSSKYTKYIQYLLYCSTWLAMSSTNASNTISSHMDKLPVGTADDLHH